jgi:hypothetical protein
MTFQSLCLLALPLLAGCANAVYRLEAGPILARANGDIAVQGAGSTFDSSAKNDLDADLDLGGVSAAAFGRLQADAERDRFRIQGFALNEGGDGTLAAAYGDIAAGSQVDTALEFFTLAGNWNHAIVRNENVRLGVGAQAGYYRFDFSVRNATNREETAAEALVPMPFVEGELRLGNVALGANFAGMYADVGDARGRFFDAEAFARWTVTSEFQVFGGDRYILFDAAGTATDRQFDADVAIDGLFFGLGVRF